MGINREFWQEKIHSAWKKSSIVWLVGVRRSGKTTLCRFFSEAAYLNCDLPSVQETLSDPENFLRTLQKDILILDEIHQLPEATRLLKIAADEYPKIKMLVTGSSAVLAGSKFKDSLTGRKRNIHLLPVLAAELNDFKADIEKRILFGGLPPALLSEELDSEFYAEWLDSFYARDIQEIFRVEKRQPFLKTLEWILIQNGSPLDVSRLAQASGISRPTAVKYLEILEATKAIAVIRPFSGNSVQEIVSQPKVYGFDTGFSCYARMITQLRSEDCGLYLENLVLETIQSLGAVPMYWRNKNGNEIDFVLPTGRDRQIVLECKWKQKNFNAKNLQIFRRQHPKGINVLVASDCRTATEERNGLLIHTVPIQHLQAFLKKYI